MFIDNHSPRSCVSKTPVDLRCFVSAVDASGSPTAASAFDGGCVVVLEESTDTSICENGTDVCGVSGTVVGVATSTAEGRGVLAFDERDGNVDLFVAGSTDRGAREIETVEDDFGKEACAGERGIATDKEVTDVKRV
jgi:hypothetical protein